MRDEECSWKLLDARGILFPTPVSEIEEESETRKDGVVCDDCGTRLTDEAYWDEGECYCETCANQLVEETKIEAESYAREYCKITGPLPEHNPDEESVIAHLADCRHNYTNYEELLERLGRRLDRFSIVGKIYYQAIRLTIEELLEDMIDEMADDESKADADIEDGE